MYIMIMLYYLKYIITEFVKQSKHAKYVHFTTFSLKFNHHKIAITNGLGVL